MGEEQIRVAQAGSDARGTNSSGGNEDAPGSAPDLSGGGGFGQETQGQGTGGNSPLPSVAAASDDDIVARQLREAAEAETDPALKEKLWEEYRKYKQGQQ